MRYGMPVPSVNVSSDASGQVAGDVASGAVMVEIGVDATAVAVPVRLADAVVPEPLALVVADPVTVFVTVATLLVADVKVRPFRVVVSTTLLVDLIVVVRVVARGTPMSTASFKSAKGVGAVDDGCNLTCLPFL